MWSFISLVGRSLFAFVGFVVLTRHLGPVGFGRYGGILALVVAVRAFTNLGTKDLVMSGAARDPSSAPREWGRLLRVSLVGSVLGAVAIAGIGSVILPSESTTTIFLIALTEFIGFGVVSGQSRAFMGLGDFRAGAAVNIGYGVARLAAVGVFVAIDSRSLQTLGLLFLSAAGVTAVLSGAALWVRCGAPRFGEPVPWRDGTALAIGTSSASISADIDKTMLLRAGFLADTGRYTAAWRLAEYAFMPVHAVLGATYPRFFKRGARGVRSTWGFARELAPRLLLLAGIVSAAVAVFAPLAEVVLGESYAGTAVMLTAIAALPFMRTCQALLGDTLTGAHLFAQRTVAVVTSAAVNVMVNLYAIPRWSWKGAVFGTYVAEILLIGMLAVLVAVQVRKAPHADPVEQ